MKGFMAAVLLATVLLTGFCSGCSQNGGITSPSEKQAPELPPASTMAMDLAFFESAEVDPKAIQSGGYDGLTLAAHPESKLNFLNAAVRVFFLDVVVCAALVEPVAAFTLAAHSVPQPQPDGSWLWTYIFIDDGIEYSIFLTGKNMYDYTEWKMEVSSTDTLDSFDHFLWFDGRVDSDDSGGYWQFYCPEEELPGLMPAVAGYESATPGVPCIRIDWENREGDEHELVFLVNQAGAPEEGSTLTYFESPNLCSVSFYDSQVDDSGTIEWYPDGSGYIQWPDYRNGQQCCWDTLQYNTECD
jgi:hypothetical protein